MQQKVKKRKVYEKRKFQVNLPLQSLEIESDPIVFEKNAWLPLGLTGVGVSGNFPDSLKSGLVLEFPERCVRRPPFSLKSASGQMLVLKRNARVSTPQSHRHLPKSCPCVFAPWP